MAEDRVALVTGASRGAGRGIAGVLGAHGLTVYVTGRTAREGDASVPGTVLATAEEVTRAGGTGVPVLCDHADDAQVAALFERIDRERGRLDLLVNNACAIHDALPAPGAFWEKPIAIGDMIDVGARSGFVAGWHAARMMAAQKHGLILFTSSPGAAHYCYGPAYGAHKAAVDKMAFDMGVDFADAGLAVAAVSVWMGALASERLLAMMAASPDLARRLEGALEPAGYTGELAWAMLNDPDVMRLNGRTLIAAELGRDYGITLPDGRYPPSVRDAHGVAPAAFHGYKIK